MAMTIECTSCHAKFAGKDEYAGRRIRCPKCQSVFRVAGDKVEAAAVVATAAFAPSTGEANGRAAENPPAAKPARPQNKYAGVEIDEWNVPDDFEYSVSEEVDENGKRCVYCHAEMRADDVLCLKCGYNRQLGQKLATKTGDEVLEEEARKLAATSISFGSWAVPKKALWIGGGVAAVVALLLLFVMPTALMVLLALGGLLLIVVGRIGVIYVAFQEDTLQGLLVLLLPIYWWVFVFSRWELAALPFIVWSAGVGMILLAGCIGWSATAQEIDAVLRVIAHAARLA